MARLLTLIAVLACIILPSLARAERSDVQEVVKLMLKQERQKNPRGFRYGIVLRFEYKAKRYSVVYERAASNPPECRYPRLTILVVPQDGRENDLVLLRDWDLQCKVDVAIIGFYKMEVGPEPARKKMLLSARHCPAPHPEMWALVGKEFEPYWNEEYRKELKNILDYLHKRT